MLAEFLKAATFPKPGFDVAIGEFCQTFNGWLAQNKHRYWTQRETSRELARSVDTYRASGNVLTAIDIAFEPQPERPPNKETVDRLRGSVRFVDQNIGYLLFINNQWQRFDANMIRSMLAVMGAYAPESYALRQHAR